ncbi:unnamed protein product, partial [Linum tenue]
MFENEQDELKGELNSLSRSLSQLARQRRNVILKGKRSRRPFNLWDKYMQQFSGSVQLETEFVNILTKRNRLYCRIHLVQKCRRQAIFKNRSNHSMCCVGGNIQVCLCYIHVFSLYFTFVSYVVDKYNMTTNCFIFRIMYLFKLQCIFGT